MSCLGCLLPKAVLYVLLYRLLEYWLYIYIYIYIYTSKVFPELQKERTAHLPFFTIRPPIVNKRICTFSPQLSCYRSYMGTDSPAPISSRSSWPSSRRQTHPSKLQTITLVYRLQQSTFLALSMGRSQLGTSYPRLLPPDTKHISYFSLNIFKASQLMSSYPLTHILIPYPSLHHRTTPSLPLGPRPHAARSLQG